MQVHVVFDGVCIRVFVLVFVLEELEEFVFVFLVSVSFIREKVPF